MDEIIIKIISSELRKHGIDPEDEDALIKCLNEASDPYRIKNATIMLQTIGTEKSIPRLMELIYYPRTDIKITSFHAIANILKEEGQEFYIDLLRNTKFPEKFSVIKAINQYCTANASKDVLARLVKIVKGKRRAVYYDKDMSELTTCLQYFLRINGPEASDAFRIIKDKVSELEPNEVSWIKNNIPNLI